MSSMRHFQTHRGKHSELAKAKRKNVRYRSQKILDGMTFFLLVGNKSFACKFQKMYLMLTKILGKIQKGGNK